MNHSTAPTSDTAGTTASASARANISNAADVANEPLFRPEAMLAQQTQLHGTIRLMQPIAYTVWALGAKHSFGTDLVENN